MNSSDALAVTEQPSDAGAVSLFPFLRRRRLERSVLWWYERGKTTRAPFWWWRFGPLVVEFHADRFSVGVVASRWFVGAYLGFVVVTFGRRVWVETAWLVGTLSMEEASRAR